MSRRGIHFLRTWIEKNIDAAPYPPHCGTRAKVLAEQCAADAQEMEISVEEIEVEVGDLSNCMVRAMDQASGRDTNGVVATPR